jgi:hypothetical protein
MQGKIDKAQEEKKVLCSTNLVKIIQFHKQYMILTPVILKITVMQHVYKFSRVLVSALLTAIIGPFFNQMPSSESYPCI